MATFQIMKDGSGRPLKSTGRVIYGKNVTVPNTNFPNGTIRRMPWAVSRDIQAAAISGKEIYFKVTHDSLKTSSALVSTGFDFEFQTLAGVVVPIVTHSYNGTTGTLFGVMKLDLAGALNATKGWFYFGNPLWTGSRDNSALTFPNATSVLFLPSGVDKSSAGLSFSGDLPTSDKTIVNPGALCDGAGSDWIQRNLTGDCGDFLYSFLAQSTVSHDDNSPLAFGSGTGTTVNFIRHLFAPASGPTGGHTDAWRCGFSTSEGDSYYETADGAAGDELQHIVVRRVSGSSLELYINGVLQTWAYKNEPSGRPQSARIDFTNQKLIIGRGSVTATRFWAGYLDCFKFYKDDAKTTAWALAEYNNLKDVNDAVIFGDPEDVNGSSLWGEALEIPCDGNDFVTFDSARYSVADKGGAIAIDSLVAPSGGTLVQQTGTNVKYTNTSNTDPDSAAVVLKNTANAKVRVPIIFDITPSIIITSGYYKTPNNFATKLSNAVTVDGRNQFLSVINQFKSNPTWYKTKAIKIINSAIIGNAVTIDTGGDVNDPLVICMAGAGTDGSWSSRPVVNAKIIPTKPYTWFYGCQFDWPRVLTATYDNIQVQLQADWQFATACRFIGNGGIGNYAPDAKIANVHINFNRFDVANTQAIMNQNGAYCVTLYFRITGSGATAWVCHPLTVGRNYWIDHSTHDGANVDIFHIGEGKDDGGHYYSDINAEYNYVKAAIKRGFYIKAGMNLRYNDIGPLVNPGGSVYGGADCVIGFRGPFARDGFCEYNRLRGGHQLMVHGPGHRIVSNVLMDSSTRIHASAYLSGVGKPTPSADRCKFVGNTGDLYLPWYLGNPDHATDNLGNFGGQILIAAHNGRVLEQAGVFVDGPVIPFSGDPGHPTGTHPWLTNASVTKQSALPAGYTIKTPPFLDTVVCGPGASGKVWGT